MAPATTPSMVKISTTSYPISSQEDKIPLTISSRCSKIRRRSPPSKPKYASHRNRSSINLHLVSAAHYPSPEPNPKLYQYRSSLTKIQTSKERPQLRSTHQLTHQVHKAVYIALKLWPK